MHDQSAVSRWVGIPEVCATLRGPHNLATSFGRYANTTPVLTIGISSDVLYPVSEVKRLAGALPNARYETLEAPQGHDAFLIEAAALDRIIRTFRTVRTSGPTPARQLTTTPLEEPHGPNQGTTTSVGIVDVGTLAVHSSNTSSAAR